ncbi:MAG TPA: diguanylate cyclase [Terriglobales bacterium]|nr:diguanylate cyclase [Terriglobales bacterium]
MKLRRIVTVYTGAITAILLLAMFAVSCAVLPKSFARLERRHVEDDLDRTRQLLHREIVELDRTATDYANWDDTYEYMLNFSPRYVRSTYSVPTLRNLGLRSVMLVNNDDRIVMLRSVKGDETESPHDANHLLRIVSGSRRGVFRSIAGVVQLSDGAVLMAAHPILNSSYKGTPRGILLMTRDFDSKLVARLSSLAQMPVSVELLPHGDAGDQSNNLALPFASTVIQDSKDDHIEALATIRGLEGEPDFRLRIVHTRDISQQGRNAIHLLLFMITALGVAFAVLNLWTVDTYVIGRILKLTKFTKTVRSGTGLAGRIDIQGNDEISELGSRMNDMLSELQASHESVLAARKRLEFEASHDSLTGMWNRAAGLDFLKKELARSSREGTEVSVVMLDLDYFKEINDRFGHSGGDAVLRNLSSVIRRNLRTFDMSARYGGEEFFIIAPNCSPDEAKSLAQRIITRIESSPINVQDSVVRATASAGVCSGTFPTASEDLLGAADRALYRAKANGRNRVECESIPGQNGRPLAKTTPLLLA